MSARGFIRNCTTSAAARRGRGFKIIIWRLTQLHSSPVGDSTRSRHNLLFRYHFNSAATTFTILFHFSRLLFLFSTILAFLI